jgi:hypothetical protein
MTNQFAITFGALAEPIGDQLEEQGITISKQNEDRFEKLAWSITHLHLNDIIPDSVRGNARKKLMKKISRCVHKVKE